MTNEEINEKIKSYQNTICYLSEQIHQLRLQIDYSQILIEDLQISVRTQSRLNNRGVYNVEQLLKLTKDDLFKIRGFFKSNFKDLTDELNRLNIPWIWEF